MTYYVSKTFILFQNKLAYLLGLNVQNGKISNLISNIKLNLRETQRQ